MTNGFQLRQQKIDHQLQVLQIQQEAKQKYGFGYKAERADIRDYTKFTLQNPQRFDDPGKKEIAEIFTNSVEIDKVNVEREDDVISFSDQFPDPRDQKFLGTCGPFGYDGVVGHNRKTMYNEIVQTSPLFLYKKTRDMANETGDVGVTIRNLIKTAVTFGYVLEEHYPYTKQNMKDFDKPIADDLEKMGQLNQATSYIRIDAPNMDRRALLDELKKYMVKNIPIEFGFACYESLDYSHKDGRIPFPGRNEVQTGGHAVVLCGYDNSMLITNPINGVKTKGAFKIRNSWGNSGEGGYYWLPYDYVLHELAMDFWAVLELEWMNWRDFD